MQIAVPSLKRGRHRITVSVDAAEYGDVAASSGLDFRAPITIQATIDKIQEEVLVHIEVSTRLGLECSRCLEPFEVEVHGAGDALFLPFRAENVDDCLGHKIQRESQQVQYYHSGLVDLGEMIIEAVGLAAPMKPLCRPDCRGFCPGCGACLKDGPCGCKPGPLTNQPFKGLF
jgi:uncharacterized protein